MLNNEMFLAKKMQQVGLSLALLVFPLNPSFAASKAELETRIGRLEQMIDTRQEYDLLRHIEQLQETISELQGQVELQNNQLRELTEGQQNLYRDLDGRLNRLSVNAESSVNEVEDNSAAVQSDSLPSEQNINSPISSKSETVERGYDLTSSTLIENTPPLAEQEAYRKAHTLLSQKKYSAAIEALQIYMKQYPQGKYVANSWYWLGEAYLIQGNNVQALQSFQQVINRFPDNPKVADALLKLGSVYMAQGNEVKARETYRMVMQRYKGTPVAKVAEAKLLAL